MIEIIKIISGYRVFLSLFILGGGGRDRIPSRLCTANTEPNVWFELTNCEIMPRAETNKTKSQTLNLLNHPGAP